MKSKDVRDWQSEFYSKDKEAHTDSSSEELNKYLDKTVKEFLRKKGVKLVKKNNDKDICDDKRA